MTNQSGVYKITNLINKKFYIGSTSNFKQRWSEHRSAVKRSPKRLMVITRAMRKYGIENFLFEIIEVCDIDNLIIREQYWLDFYQNYNRKIGYNIAKCVESCNRGVPMSEETKKKISKAKTGLYAGENNPFYGKKHSEETRLILSNKNKGKMGGDKNPMFGKTHSIEARRKISLAGIGRNNGLSKPVKQIDKNTGEIIKIWPSANKATQGLGKKASHISSVCNKSSKHKTALGFLWEYV